MTGLRIIDAQLYSFSYQVVLSKLVRAHSGFCFHCDVYGGARLSRDSSAFVKVDLNLCRTRQLAFVTFGDLSKVRVPCSLYPSGFSNTCWLFCCFWDHPLKHGLWLKVIQFLKATMSVSQGLSLNIPYLTYHIIILTYYCCISSEKALRCLLTMSNTISSAQLCHPRGITEASVHYIQASVPKGALLLLEQSKLPLGWVWWCYATSYGSDSLANSLADAMLCLFDVVNLIESFKIQYILFLTLFVCAIHH